MPILDIPESLVIYEHEHAFLSPEIDLRYIDEAANDIAAIIAHHGVAEIAYQPGDGTFYGLVFVPLQLLEYARPRVKDGFPWDRHAVRGMKRAGAKAADGGGEYYGRDGFLISYLDHASYPLRLRRDGEVISADYVAEHWNAKGASAVSLALLFRAVAHHLGT